MWNTASIAGSGRQCAIFALKAFTVTGLLVGVHRVARAASIALGRRARRKKRIIFKIAIRNAWIARLDTNLIGLKASVSLARAQLGFITVTSVRVISARCASMVSTFGRLMGTNNV